MKFNHHNIFASFLLAILMSRMHKKCLLGSYYYLVLTTASIYHRCNAKKVKTTNLLQVVLPLKKWLFPMGQNNKKITFNVFSHCYLEICITINKYVLYIRCMCCKKIEQLMIMHFVNTKNVSYYLFYAQVNFFLLFHWCQNITYIVRHLSILLATWSNY